MNTENTENITPAGTGTDASAERVTVGIDVPKPFMRTIKSFIRRAGRTTAGQAKAFEVLGPKFLVPYQTSLLDLQALFVRPVAEEGTSPTQEVRMAEDSAQVKEEPAQREGDTEQSPLPPGRPAGYPIVLEIGFGMGEATAHIAKVLLETNFLCCEVHEPGVGALLKRIGENGITNIRICAHDAVEVIDHMLPLSSLDGVHIFFPDPWHKTKHNKRRLIQSQLVAKLAARLKPGGYLHCATDWQPYAEQILEVLSAEPLLRNRALISHPQLEGYAPKPLYRPLTKFENRGIRLGHGVWDVVFELV
jgi:tRNA (guanine-N7-)-methyltransferase